MYYQRAIRKVAQVRSYDEFGDSWLEDVTTMDVRKKNKQVELY